MTGKATEISNLHAPTVEGLGLELLHPEKIEVLVSVLRGEGDEAAFGEARCEGLVGIKVGLPGHVLGRAFEPVLADDDRSTLAWLQIPRYQQKPPSRTLRKNVDDDFVSDPPR